ncbi:MAG: glycosyltransferase [Synergistaceae bacterium]|nr:glycosyltransferase [Synergistaceae bacterium]
MRDMEECVGSVRLANGFARDGLTVTLLPLRKKGRLLGELDSEVGAVDFGGSFLRLLAWLRSNPIDFLISDYTSMRSLLAKLFLRMPFHVVLLQQNMFTMDRNFIQMKLRFARCRLLYPLASACVCVSNGVAEEMKTLGLLAPDKIRAIYNPVVTRELLAQMDAPPEHPWFAEGEPPVVLGVGRLGDQKDFATLIRAFALLAPRRPGLRLVILGEGKQRTMLERLVREEKLTDRVSMPGYSANPYSCMKRAALFVLTSLFEGFGNVAAEALACGCNVVATDCKSGPAEILDNSRYGWLTKVGDPHDVARAMEEALSRPMPAEKLRERAESFSAKRIAGEYERLFEDLRSRERFA